MKNQSTASEESIAASLSNSTLNCNSMQKTLKLQAAGAMAYCLMIFLSVVGNILVVLIVYRKQTMRTITYYLMANIAVADVIFFVFAGPRQIVEVFTEPSRWLVKENAGVFFCKFSSFCMDTCQVVSVYSSVAIGINRWIVVMYPNDHIFNAVKAKHLITGVWLFCMLMFVHYFKSFNLTSSNRFYYCHLDLAANELTAYVITMTLFQYVLPLTMMTLCYFKVISKLKENRIPGSPSPAAAKRRKHRNRRVTKIALAITVAFVVLWTPFVIYGYAIVFVWDHSKICRYIDIRFAALFIAHSYSMINPWIYFSFSGQFRLGLKELWASFKVHITSLVTKSVSCLTVKTNNEAA